MNTLREHIYDTIHRNRKPLKQIAEDVDMSVNTVTKWGLPDQEESDTGSGWKMPVKKLTALTLSTNDYQILDHIEHQVGRVAIRLPKPNASHPQIYRLTLKAVKEFGDLMSQVDTSLADNRLNDAERERVIHEGQHALQAIVNLLHALDAGRTE